MNELAVLPVPHVDFAAQAELADRMEARVLSPARTRGYELRLVGATVLPHGKVISRSQWGTWLFVEHWDDPTAPQYGGKIPIPAAEHTKLTTLVEAGVRPDLLWLAHELPAGWKEGDRLDQLVPAPAHLRKKDERLVRQLQKITSATMKVAGATAGAVSGLLTDGVGLDPIVLGGVRHPEYPIVMWTVLAQWEWI